MHGFKTSSRLAAPLSARQRKGSYMAMVAELTIVVKALPVNGISFAAICPRSCASNHHNGHN
jgi:hypothetical protein